MTAAMNSEATSASWDAEYIVVGSGAGGGTVAARLAEAGHTVILLEAGGEPVTRDFLMQTVWGHEYVTEDALNRTVSKLRKFISDRGKIRARRVSGNCTQHQRDVATAIKNAREMALLPYTSTAR